MVFGAGASSPPLPSQAGILDELWKVSGIERIEPAKLYLARAFPGLPNKTARFEDVVGPLEISESEEYWYHFAGKSGTDQPTTVTNQDVLDSLDSWVAMCLDPATLPPIPSSEDSPDSSRVKEFNRYYAASENGLPYAKLVDLLDRFGELERTAFVTLNYDLLLDRVFLASGRFVPDYAIEGFIDDPPPGRERRPQKPIRLLKMHGSLNWRVCDRCHVLRNLGIYSVWLRSNCIDCKAKEARPLLIRPTLLKDFRHRVWQDVWRTAGHTLATARTWVFVGYSLPLADVWMLRLLSQSLRSGGFGPNQRRLVVVNPDVSAKERFSLIFPKLDFYAGTFDSWVDGCRKSGSIP